MDQKGVMSIDLLFATLILLIIISAVVGIVSTGINTAETSEFARAKVLADNIARAVDVVYTNGPGASLNITLPGDFPFTKAEVTALNGKGAVVVYYMGKTSVSYVIPKPVKLPNVAVMDPNETYTIRNVDGEIQIEKVS